MSPSNRDLYTNSFADSSLAIPNFPDSGKREGQEKKFSFVNIPIAESENDYTNTEDKAETMVTVRPQKFDSINKISIEQKIRILASDSLLIPILIGHDGIVVSNMEDDSTDKANQECKQVFLVHLQVRKMAVTVYTSEEFAGEN